MQLLKIAVNYQTEHIVFKRMHSSATCGPRVDPTTEPTTTTTTTNNNDNNNNDHDDNNTYDNEKADNSNNAIIYSIHIHMLTHTLAAARGASRRWTPRLTSLVEF